MSAYQMLDTGYIVVNNWHVLSEWSLQLVRELDKSLNK